MLTWLAPVGVFGLVVFVHELGHFLAAKFTGVYAPVFSFGWGPRLWGFRRGETDYRISWLPVGGFVAMASKDSEGASGIEGGTDVGAEAATEEGTPGHQRGLNPIPFDADALRPFGPHPVPPARWIESKPLWAKVFVLAAGVIMNVLLTLVVSIGTFAGYGRPYLPAVVDSVVAGLPAAGAGLLPGDSIVAVNSVAVKRWPDLVEKISGSGTTSLQVDVIRGAGERVQLSMVPQVVADTDAVTGQPVQVPKIGIVPVRRTSRESLGLPAAAAAGFQTTVAMGANVFQVVGGLLTGKVSVKQLGGPIAIAKTSYEAAKTGFETVLYLLAFLSINIAILNLLPIPMLDGGQILLRVIESVRGVQFSARTTEYIMRVGVLAILSLFVLVMFNDIKTLFT